MYKTMQAHYQILNFNTGQLFLIYINQKLVHTHMNSTHPTRELRIAAINDQIEVCKQELSWLESRVPGGKYDATKAMILDYYIRKVRPNNKMKDRQIAHDECRTQLAKYRHLPDHNHHSLSETTINDMTNQ